MNKIKKIIVLSLSLFCTINQTITYYNTNDIIINDFFTEKYNLKISGDGGNFSSKNIIVKNNSIILPTPQKYGYEFVGYVDENDNQYSTNITNIKEINDKSLLADWNIINYSIDYDLDGGVADTINSYNVEDNIVLPIPTKKGYTFTGWLGTGLEAATQNVSFNNSIGNRNYIATWQQNYYKVNYYVNNNLWEQRIVGYNDKLENLSAQSLLDGYHTFHGWDGWVSNMPDYDVDLYANITESYCRLMTGHGEYGNAVALLNVFNLAGWTGRVEQVGTEGYYWVVTDYNLTRAQAETQKSYLASHTNYTNYNFPYLYWISLECTNGISIQWSRTFGQSNFN